MIQIDTHINGFSTLDINGLTEEEVQALYALLSQRNSQNGAYTGLESLTERLHHVLQEECPGTIDPYGTSLLFEFRCIEMRHSWSLHKKEPV